MVAADQPSQVEGDPDVYRGRVCASVDRAKARADTKPFAHMHGSAQPSVECPVVSLGLPRGVERRG